MAYAQNRDRPTYSEIDRHHCNMMKVKREVGVDSLEYKVLAQTYEKMHDAWIKAGMYEYWDSL